MAALLAAKLVSSLRTASVLAAADTPLLARRCKRAPVPMPVPVPVPAAAEEEWARARGELSAQSAAAAALSQA